MMHDQVTAAREMATQAHHGQTDKTGHPYIDHPRRVAEYVAAHARPDDLADAQTVAWLHDVVEDTGTTLADLATTFPPHVVAAVDAITKHPGQALEDYYRVVSSNPLALAVKHADLDDNTDPERTAALDPATRERLAQKYAKARSLLSVSPASSPA